MKQTIMVAAAISIAAATVASAQDTMRVKPKDSTKVTQTTITSNGDVTDTTKAEWWVPTGAVCSTVDVNAAKAIPVKSDLYKADAGMISPDSAKIVALCAVPGQIGSGKMEMADGRTTYKIDIIPNDKKTHTDVVIDANTGAVLYSKQFGGLRGLAGWVRESAQHKMNKKPPTDTVTTTKSTTVKTSTTTVKPPV